MPTTRPRLRRARIVELRRGVLLWLAAAVVFTLWPQLDLAVSGAFHDAARGGFYGDPWWPVQLSYTVVPWIGRVLTLATALLVLWGHVGHRRARRRPWLVRWRRRAAMLLWVLLLGLALAVNGGLKEHWGRARPNAVSAFGGERSFQPALLPGAAQCEHNCSFVSGHAATGFALIAIGLAGAPRTRRRWLAVGLAAGLLVGLGRIVQGGHFLSDVLFSGLVIWLVGWGVHYAWLLWRARRLKRRGHTPC